jgi:DNA replication and repair protein RecF
VFLEYLEVRNFRNFEGVVFTFTPETNVITGMNGVGKTNLLEAIAYISYAHSFRDVEDRDLVRWGESYFRIEGTLVREKVRYRIKISYLIDGEGRKKRIFINGKLTNRVRDLFRLWPLLTLSSRDHRLIDGSPNERRRYLDRFISKVDPLYASYLHRYTKALEQKNSLLRRGERLEEVRLWNRRLEETGSYLIRARSRWIERLAEKMRDGIGELVRGKVFEMSYEPSLALEDGILDGYLNEEIERGVAVYGPHRDGVTFCLDGKPMQVSASEGEKRVVLHMWVVAQKLLIREVLGKEPVLVLDDPFSVLGEGLSRELLESERMIGGQIFLSTVDPIPGFDPGIVLPVKEVVN